MINLTESEQMTLRKVLANIFAPTLDYDKDLRLYETDLNLTLQSYELANLRNIYTKLNKL